MFRVVLQLAVAFMVLAGSAHTSAGSARILKVLPHLLDADGRNAVSPSLYDRDAYQAHLRRHPDLCHGLRFDVHWRARGVPGPLTLRIELLTSRHRAQPLVLEQPVQPRRWFSRWSALKLEGDAHREAGELIAWRATLWNGDRQVAEQKSFLW